jgi:hypothetical protein
MQLRVGLAPATTLATRFVSFGGVHLDNPIDIWTIQ